MNDQLDDPTPDPLSDAEVEVLLERMAVTFPQQPVPLTKLVREAALARRRRARQVVAASVAACVVIVGGAVGLSALARPSGGVATEPNATARCIPGETERGEPARVPRGPDYPTNAEGLTYGRDPRGAYPQPDLLAAIGDCGTSGYVLSRDLDEEAPWEPGAGDGRPRTLALFESDGVTQIDTFTTERGESEVAPDSASGVGSADIQRRWDVIIGGVNRPDGSQAFDTFRDVALTITVEGDVLRLWDGCQVWKVGFSLVDGDFSLAGSPARIGSAKVGCLRAAPLPAIVENVRLVTQDGQRVHFHLANGQIVLVLTPG